MYTTEEAQNNEKSMNASLLPDEQTIFPLKQTHIFYPT
jgi:hypothetical protein